MAQLVDELYQLGVEDVVLSPGARSTPLAMLFCEHKFNIYMDVDERSAAFFALGIAKAKNKAAVLVCTSGSACGHYMPAVIEAKHSRIPLIILTADRPPELQNVGAPQTINQHNIFGNFVKYYEELAIDSVLNSTENPSYARLVMQKAFVHAHSNPRMAVHINVPLREPLVPELQHLNFSEGRLKPPFTFMQGTVENKPFCDFFYNHCLGKKGIIICGPHTVQSSDAYYEDLISLSAMLHAPLLVDPLSQFRAFAHDNIISSYDAFLKNTDATHELQADYILLLGQAPVSKSLFNFIKNHKNAQIFQLSDCVEYGNPALNTTSIIQISAWSFARYMLENEVNYDFTNAKHYLAKWQSWQEKMLSCLNKAQSAEIMFEGKVIQLIQDITCKYSAHNLQAKLQLVIANSMTIRHMDSFWQAKNQSINVYGNRGVNGIDGTISTALGIAASSINQNPTVLITGDLAFFHDLTGLLVGKKHAINLTIVIFNNNGGGIFQYLPQSKAKNFEFLFLTPHDLDFSAVAKLYNIDYHTVNTYAEFNAIFASSLQKNGINIIEIPINMQESKKLHQLCQQLN